MMTYDMLLSEIAHVGGVMAVATAVIVIVYMVIAIAVYRTQLESISCGKIIAISVIALILIVIVGSAGIQTIDTMKRGFCDIGEHVQTTAEYNSAYHIPFEGVVLEHVKGNKRVVVDRNGTPQTFHIRWLEED